MKLTQLRALEVLDSNGKPTITVEAYSKELRAKATVPGGTSTGTYEAKTVNTSEAVNIINKLSNQLKGKNIEDIESLITNQPGNITTGISMALWRLMALSQGKELYSYFGGTTLPVPFMNVINGGAHAGNKLSFQEFLIAPLGRTFKESLKMGVEVYHALKQTIENKYGTSPINHGIEGGYAPNMKHVEEALNTIRNTLSRLGYSEEVRIGIDAAANQYYHNNNYIVNNKRMNKDKLMNYYEKLAQEYNLISIEDPFNENDYEAYSELRERLKNKTLIVTDDLTVTNPERVTTAINNKSGNCLLLKINQVGSVNKALESAGMVIREGWKVMVSHRSGDSCDSFISDLAVGINTGLIKAGAPCRGERVAKYNRLLDIEDKLGSKARYNTKII